jgi:hypothetical protein
LPVKEFKVKFRILNSEKDELEVEEGRGPVMELESNARVFNCFNNKIVEGKDPVREFFERFKDFNSKKFPRLSGSCPLRLQELNSISTM